MSVLHRSRSERRRRTRLLTHPGRTAAVGAVGLAVAVAIPVTAVVGVRTIADSKTGEIAVTIPGREYTVLPDTPGALLVERDTEGTVVGLTVLAVNRAGRGGTVVIVPTSTVTTAPDGTMRRIGDAFADGGLEAQQQAVEGLLGVSLRTAAEMNQANLGPLLAPYAPMTVNFEDRVVDTVDGEDETIVDQRSRDLTGDDAARVLLARKEGESEIARLGRIGAVWDAVLGESTTLDTTVTTVAPAAGGSATTAVPTDATVADFLQAIVGGPHGVQTLSIVGCEPDANGAEQFDVDSPAAVHLLMAQVLPGAVSTAAGSRVRLVQPRPDQQELVTATQRLLDQGMNVVLANSGGDTALPDHTTIEYYAPEAAAAASALAASGQFGPAASVAASTEAVRGIDLTVTLGSDFSVLAAAAGPPTTAAPCAPRPVNTTTEEDG